MNLSQITLIISSSLVSAISTAFIRYTLRDRFLWKGSLAALISDAFSLIADPLFLVAIAIFIVANVLWMLVLGSTKVAVAYPAQVGLVLCWNSVIAYFVLAESLSVIGTTGLLLVVIGVAMLLI